MDCSSYAGELLKQENTMLKNEVVGLKQVLEISEAARRADQETLRSFRKLFGVKTNTIH